MAFKNKTKNRNPINQNRTIDAIHEDILNGFEKEKNIKNYYEQSSILTKKINKLQNQLNQNKNIIETLEIQQKLWSYENLLKENNNKIYNIENNVDETEYLINTGSILNEYYKIQDNKIGQSENKLLKLNVKSESKKKDKSSHLIGLEMKKKILMKLIIQN